MSYQNLGQIDHNLHNRVSDDICKPPKATMFILGHKVHLGHASLHDRPEKRAIFNNGKIWAT